jgi:hypothetical protein
MSALRTRHQQHLSRCAVEGVSTAKRREVGAAKVNVKLRLPPHALKTFALLPPPPEKNKLSTTTSLICMG